MDDNTILCTCKMRFSGHIIQKVNRSFSPFRIVFPHFFIPIEHLALFCIFLSFFGFFVVFS